MALTEAGAMAIGAGVSAASTAAQISMGGKMNQRAQHEAWRTREWQTKEREAAQQWNLEQWNRQNAYNSPAEQLKRAREAGINPLAVINGEFRPTEAGMPSGAQAPGGAQASFTNPAANLPIDGMVNSGLQYMQYQLAKKQTKAQIDKLDAESMHQRAQAMSESLTLHGRLRMQDMTITLQGDEHNLSKQKVQNMMQDLLTSRMHMAESFQQLQNAGVDNIYKRVMVHIANERWPYEKKKLAAEISREICQKWGIREDNIGKHYDNEMKRHELAVYYENGAENPNGDHPNSNFRKHINYQLNQEYSRALQEIGNTYSPESYSILKGLRVTQEIEQTLLPFCQNLLRKGVTLPGAARSAANPQQGFKGFSKVERGVQPSNFQAGKAPFW